MEEGEGGYCHHYKDCVAPLGCPAWCQVAGTSGKRSAGTARAVGRCLEAGLEMTEQPVCPGCQSGRRWWGRGVLCVFWKPCFFPLCISLSRLCSPALRQLILPDGSGSAWVEKSPCLEAGRGWPWRPDGSIPLSRPSRKPFSVGDLWAAGCATVPWNGVGAALIQERLGEMKGGGSGGVRSRCRRALDWEGRRPSHRGPWK